MPVMASTLHFLLDPESRSVQKKKTKTLLHAEVCDYNCDDFSPRKSSARRHPILTFKSAIFQQVLCCRMPGRDFFNFRNKLAQAVVLLSILDDSVPPSILSDLSWNR